jgi:hypothetical protein
MKKDLYLSIIFFFLIFFGAFYLSSFKEISLGAEYWCIAEALVRGDGFSDPFCAPEGSSARTAWMPPLLSYLQAGIYLLFGLNSFASIFMLLLMSKAALALALFFLLRLANEVNSKYRHVCIALFAGYIMMNPGSFLLSFHDIWLITVAVMAIPYVLYFHFIKKTLSLSPVLILAALLPLTSPILSLSFVSVVAYLFLKEYFIHWKSHQEVRGLLTHKTRSIPKLIIIALVFLCPVMVWGTRNYLTFNKFIPVKSNLWFDFYQANVYDQDGLVTGFTFANYHPIKNKSRLQEYQETGETKLMDLHKQESKRYLQENTADYFRKVRNRLYASFIYAKHPYDEDYKIDDEMLSEADMLLLRNHKIVSENNSLNMQMTPDTFNTRISSIGLHNNTQVVNAWQNAYHEYQQQFSSPVRILESTLISGIPFLAWMLSLLFIQKFDRRKELFIMISILYLSYLLPYAMVSIHTRYQVPLSPLFSLMIYFGFMLLIHRIKPALLINNRQIKNNKQEVLPGKMPVQKI